MADPTQTPDMQGAGMPGPPEQMSQGGLLDALRSRGTLPAGLGQQMAAPQANPGLAFGSGVLNALSGGNAAQNPYLTGVQEQANKQFWQMQHLQDRAQRAKDKQQELALTISRDLANSDIPEARMTGWQNLGKLSGVKFAPGVLESLGRGKVSKDDLQAAVLERMAGVDPKMILAMHPGMTPQHIPFLDQLNKSPDYMRKLGIDPEAVQMRRDEFMLKKRAADLAALKADLAERRQTSLEERQLSAEERASRNEARADRRLDIMEKSLAQRVGTKEEKQKQTFEVMGNALDTMSDLAARLDDKGYLPKTAAGPMAGMLKGDPSALKARANQEYFQNDPDWQAWKQLQASLVGFDRTVLNDIGARAFQAFKNQFAFFDNPPTKAAIDQTIAQMRSMLATAKGQGGAPAAERITIRVGKDYYTKDWHRGEPLPPGAEIIKVE